MLLVLRLVVDGQLTPLLVNSLTEETAFIMRSLDVVLQSLDLDVFLIEHGLGIHDVSIDRVALSGKVRIGSLHVLELALEDLRVSSLLLDLLFVVLAQVAHAVLKHSLVLLHLLDPQSQLLVQRV